MSVFVQLQHLLPHHALSRLAGMLANTRIPWLRDVLIRTFARVYGVDMSEAVQPDLAGYSSFNDFFTRPLVTHARPIDPASDAVVSPADGVVSQTGIIERGELLQAKGIRYSFGALADDCAGPEYEGGAFVTVYLSPSDYHRVHLPLAGRLVRSVAIPGKLFSVNAATEREVEGLFAINERLVMEFETEAGKMLVVMVGAMIVASIETVWEGPRSPYRSKTITLHNETFEKGAEIGRFLLGSSVVLAFETGSVQLDQGLEPGLVLRMGQSIGRGT